MTRHREEEEETTAVVPLATTQGQVTAVPSRDRCSVTVLAGPATGALVAMSGDQLVVGRGSEVRVSIDRSGPLRGGYNAHRRRGDARFIEDLASRNGTFVDGELATEPRVRARRRARAHRPRDGAAHRPARRTREGRAAQALRVRGPRLAHAALYNRRYLGRAPARRGRVRVRHRSPLGLIPSSTSTTSSA